MIQRTHYPDLLAHDRRYRKSQDISRSWRIPFLAIIPRKRKEEDFLPACLPLWASLRIAVKSSSGECQRRRMHPPRELRVGQSFHPPAFSVPVLRIRTRYAFKMCRESARPCAEKCNARVTLAAACHKDSCLPLHRVAFVKG